MDREEYALMGEELEAATPKDAERLDREYEREDFLANQCVGYKWEPTRKILINHILQQMDDYDRIRRCQLWVTIVQALILIALLVSGIIGR